MTQIRQEINILDHSVSATTGNVTANEIARVDTTRYNGTVTYYLEVLATNSSTSDRSCTLFIGAQSQVTVTVTASTSNMTLFRSASFTPTAPNSDHTIRLNGAGTGTLTVKSARIVVIQNASPLTKTQTQIEIGNYNTGRTVESATILTNPKYWKYDASRWDGTTTFYAEAVYDSGDMDTVTVGIYESTAIDAPSWSLKTTIVSAATTTVPTRTRVSFTPVDGRYYTIFSHNGSMDNHDIYRAGVIVDQIGTTTATATYYVDTSVSGPTDPNAVWTNDANAFDGSTSTFASVSVTGNVNTNYLQGFGTTAPSTGEVITQVRARVFVGSDTAGGAWSSYATLTEPSAGWSWPLLQSEVYAKVYAADPGQVGGYAAIYHDEAIDILMGTPSLTLSDLDISRVDIYKVELEVTYVTGGLTKLEPQYLLANTLFAAGTALQTFLTKWDSTEWSGVTNTYYFEACAANGSTSDVTLDQADGGGVVTNSTLTNIDNCQTSAAMTMPGDENLDTKATTNAGDVASARIVVATVFAADTTLSISSVFDAISITESVTPSNTQLGGVSVNDVVTITESVLRTLVSDISVSDLLTITESLTVANTELGGVNVNDLLTITESVSTANTQLGGVSVSDSISVTENVFMLQISFIDSSDGRTFIRSGIRLIG